MHVYGASSWQQFAFGCTHMIHVRYPDSRNVQWRVARFKNMSSIRKMLQRLKWYRRYFGFVNDIQIWNNTVEIQKKQQTNFIKKTEETTLQLKQFFLIPTCKNQYRKRIPFPNWNKLSYQITNSAYVYFFKPAYCIIKSFNDEYYGSLLRHYNKSHLQWLPPDLSE